MFIIYCTYIAYKILHNVHILYTYTHIYTSIYINKNVRVCMCMCVPYPLPMENKTDGILSAMFDI